MDKKKPPVQLRISFIQLTFLGFLTWLGMMVGGCSTASMKWPNRMGSSPYFSPSTSAAPDSSPSPRQYLSIDAIENEMIQAPQSLHAGESLAADKDKPVP